MTIAILFYLLLVLAPFVLALGAVIDQRDKTEAYRGGSSQIAVYLTAIKAQTAFADPSAAAGWYMPSYQESTQIGPDRDTEEVKDEADNLILARDTRNEFVITTTFFQTDDDTLRLLTYLEDPANASPVRYPMPTNTDGETQWVFLYSGTVRKENWRLAAANNAQRTRQATFVGSNDDNGDLYEIVTLPASQADARWTPYAAFKDTPA